MTEALKTFQVNRRFLKLVDEIHQKLFGIPVEEIKSVLQDAEELEEDGWSPQFFIRINVDGSVCVTATPKVIGTLN